MPAVDQAQAQSAAAVHSAATQATAALNKLAKALQDAGVEQATIAEVDEMSNQANALASAAVGNAPPEPAVEPPAEVPTQPGTEPPGSIGAATEDFARELNPEGFPPAA